MKIEDLKCMYMSQSKVKVKKVFQMINDNIL
jgi:hypothetical protein